MVAPETASTLHEASDAAFDETGVKRELSGTAWKIVAGTALTFSTYQLFIAAFSPRQPAVLKSPFPSVGMESALANVLPTARHAAA